MRLIWIASLMVVTMVSSAHADIVTQWNFNRIGPALPNAASPAPSVGSGTASVLGGVIPVAAFASGNANGGSSDPVTIAPSADNGNLGWQLQGGWNANASNLTQGVSFAVSTSGFQDDVTISWDLRQSNSSSRFSAFQYTVDGSTWQTLTDPSRITIGSDPVATPSSNGSVTSGGLLSRTLGDRWLNVNTANLSGLGAGGNSAFQFRVVAAFDPNGSSFVQTSSGSAPIADGGSWRFDMVTVSASAVPEPTSIALLSLVGGAGLIARVRRRKVQN